MSAYGACGVCIIYLLIVGVCCRENVTEDEISVIGNDVIPGKELHSSPRSFVFTEIPIPSGILTSIKIFSAGPGLPIRFQVWKHVSAIQYRMVASTRHVTGSYGVEEIDLVSQNSALLTEPTYYLGFTTESSTCAITYNLAPFHNGAVTKAHLVSHSVEGSDYPERGSKYAFGGDFFDKKFSIQWTIDTESIYCDLNNGGCAQICYQGISDRLGRCRCIHGYVLARDNKTCIDKNECDVISSCKSREVCINTDGSYVCVPANGNKPAIQASSATVPSPLLTNDIILALLCWLAVVTLVLIVGVGVVACFVVRLKKSASTSQTDGTTSEVNFVRDSWIDMTYDAYKEMHV